MKKLYSHPWLTVTGNKKGSILIETNPFVIVVPYLGNGELLVETQYKEGAGRKLMGFPAGYINKGETPLLAGKRELMEETGYSATGWIPAGTFYENPSINKAPFFVYIATGLKKEKTIENPDTQESPITVSKISIEDFKYNLHSVKSSPMLTAYLALEYIK